MAQQSHKNNFYLSTHVFDMYHPVVEKIKKLLKENSVWFETFEHEPVRTSEEAVKVRTGYTLEQGAKAIIVRVKKMGEGKFFAMLVLPANKKFDSVKLKNNLGFSDVRFATEEEVAEITGGVLPGGVPPFGTIFNLPVFVDFGLKENQKIIFNAGDRRYSVAMRSEDYLSLVKPTEVDIAG